MKSTKYAPHYYETKLPTLIRQQRAQRLSSGAMRKKSVLDEFVIGGQMNECRPLAFGMLRMPANLCLNQDAQEMSIINKSHAIALFEDTELLASSMLNSAMFEAEQSDHGTLSSSLDELYGPYGREICKEFPKFFAASALAEHIGKSPLRIDMNLNDFYPRLVEIYSELGIESLFVIANLNKHADTLSSLTFGISQAMRLVCGRTEQMVTAQVIRSAERGTISKFLIKNNRCNSNFSMEKHYWGLRIAKAHMADEPAFNEICNLLAEVDFLTDGLYLNGKCVREFLAQIASEYKKELLMAELEV